MPIEMEIMIPIVSRNGKKVLSISNPAAFKMRLIHYGFLVIMSR